MSLTVLRELWVKLYISRWVSVTQKIRGEAHAKSEEGTTLSHLCKLTEPHRRECAVCPEGVQECHATSCCHYVPSSMGVFQEHDQFCTHTFLQNPTDLKATLMVYFLFRIGREGLHVFHGRCRNLGDQAPAETGISTQPCNPVTFCNLCIVCLRPAGQQSWLLGTNGTFFQ